MAIIVTKSCSSGLILSQAFLAAALLNFFGYAFQKVSNKVGDIGVSFLVFSSLFNSCGLCAVSVAVSVALSVV